MKCRIEGCNNEAWPAWNDICRECLAEIDWQPSDEDNGEPTDEDQEAQDYEERIESHGK